MEWIALWQTFNGAFEVTLLIFRFGTSPTNQKNPTNLEHSWVTRLWQLHRAWPLCTGCRGQLCPGLQVSQNGWALKASCDPIQNMGLYQLHSASGPQWWNPDRSDYSCAVINTCFRCQLLQMPFYRKKQDFFPLFIFLQVPWPGNLTFSGSHLCTFQLFLNPISDMYWQQNGSENSLHPPRGNANITTLWECSTSVISPLLPTFIFSSIHSKRLLFYTTFSICCPAARLLSQYSKLKHLSCCNIHTKKPALAFPCFLKENGKKKSGGMYSTSWQACFCFEHCRNCQSVLDLCENNTCVLLPRSISPVHWAGKQKFIT